MFHRTILVKSQKKKASITVVRIIAFVSKKKKKEEERTRRDKLYILPANGSLKEFRLLAKAGEGQRLRGETSERGTGKTKGGEKVVSKSVRWIK